MTRFRTSLLSATALALIASGPAFALDGVVASIKPVHSLVAAVMEGVGEPSLIVQGAGSPHTYSMRPSEARMLEGASVLFWIGPDLEMFLRAPVETLAGNATVVELGAADGLTVLPYREGGPFESHDHAHDHEASEGGHDHSHDHDSADHAHNDADEHAHDHSHDHGHGAYDTHLWLDPENAKVFVGEIEAALSAADPDNAETYAQNAAATVERLDGLIEDTRAALEAVENRGFVVFHDAYQYYENRFDFPAAGSITVSPEVMPGAQRLGEIRDRIRELGVACVFSEPQFEPRLVSVVMEGTDARAGVLDPYGADLADGPDTYFEAMANLTTSLTQCLNGEG
ncbi:zinc ABC transporter solute-binding protein [Aliihoeflea aestuarii]|uniref:zinc ABC transporter substrate-binding protein n=1 Tax=Aliihoeflea aestuarii TaxID=453840 RepID=UPI002092CEC1|nr:zinc ABC transporter substrate-binding protein [Aliihoeflea aestuarii]MCO6391717.1 zinc ABC transporter solute-binding protein [Aliihoeflea aestuarii]